MPKRGRGLRGPRPRLCIAVGGVCTKKTYRFCGKIAAVFLAVSIFLSSAFVPADAVVADLGVSALLSFLQAGGVTATFGTGTDRQSVVDSISDLYGQFAGGLDQLRQYVSDGAIYVTNDARIVILSTVVQAFRNFADWLKSEKGLDDDTSIQIAPGVTTVTFSDMDYIVYSGIRNITFVNGLGPDDIPDGVIRYPDSGSYRIVIDNYRYVNVNPQSMTGYFPLLNGGTSSNFMSEKPGYCVFSVTDGVYSLFRCTWNSKNRQWWYFYMIDIIPPSVFETAVDVPGWGFRGAGISMPGADVVDTADGAVALDVGAAIGATDADIALGVVDATIAGDLAVTATDVVATDTPVADDLDSLGLPGLGAAVTSRFPFCIPWDLYAVYHTLDADPVPPYFTVDLMEPLADKLDFQGDTSITLDMSEERFETLGTISRWATYIGFLLLLVFWTKRLIWVG